MNTTTEVTEYRVRVRCNSCFRNSWVTVQAGFDCNHVPCGRCGKPDAVDFKRIPIRAEKDHGPKCAGPCQSSKSGDCECRCGGKNHGICA
jgi:hypothetical protein